MHGFRFFLTIALASLTGRLTLNVKTHKNSTFSFKTSVSLEVYLLGFRHCAPFPLKPRPCSWLWFNKRSTSVIQKNMMHYSNNNNDNNISLHWIQKQNWGCIEMLFFRLGWNASRVYSFPKVSIQENKLIIGLEDHLNPGEEMSGKMRKEQWQTKIWLSIYRRWQH